MSEGFKRFVENTQEQKPLGKGVESRVYSDLRNPNRVVKIREKALDIRTEKSRFFLTKILHLLFPQNIPDIYEVTSSPSTSTHQKVEVDPIHKKAQGSSIWKFWDLDDPEKASTKLENNPKVRELIQKLASLGVRIDRNGVNFTIGPDGQAVYLDNLSNWDHLAPEKLKKQ